MIRSQERLGHLIRHLLYHIKSVELRMLCASTDFKGDSKHRLNQAINKTRNAIDSVCDMFNNQEVKLKLKKHLDEVDLVYYMTLTEQLFDLKTEDLDAITDMIDDYLKNKYQNNPDEKTS
jgi:hypothetical protein